jgi:hypothetical protein
LTFETVVFEEKPRNTAHPQNLRLGDFEFMLAPLDFGVNL